MEEGTVLNKGARESSVWGSEGQRPERDEGARLVAMRKKNISGRGNN